MSRPPKALIVALVALVALTVLAAPQVAAAAPPATSPGAAGSTPPGTAPASRVVTPVFSARRAPGFIRARIADRRLAESIDTQLAELPPTSCLSVSDHGRRVLDRNATDPVEPASTAKILTATAVTRALDPAKPLTTRVVAASPANGGIIEGNVWVVGGGDPLLTTAGYQQSFEDRAQAVVAYGDLADAVRAAGVTEIRGDIVGDESRYDTVRWVDSWPERFRRQDTVGPLSALLVNDGKTGYVADPDAPSTQRKPGDPPVLAADTLKTLLADRGVTVTGTAQSGTAPPGAVEVAHLDSLPLGEIVGEMLADSDNTTAESLTKELGRHVSGSGSTAAGIAATQTILTDMGLPMDGVVLRDGSGLDDGNRLTCNLLVTLLDELGAESVVAQGFAVSGKKGTLRKELRGALEGKVQAKTGTLTNPPVIALAGFLTTSGDQSLTFAFVQNGTGADATKRDKIMATLAAYPQAPPVADLGPLPVR